MRGFTLLEVMVALAILSGVLVTVLGSFNYHLALTAGDRDEETALMLGREKLETLVLEHPQGQDTAEGNFAPAFPGYAWKVQTLPTDLQWISKVLLTVSWDDRKKSVALIRYQTKQQ